MPVNPVCKTGSEWSKLLSKDKMTRAFKYSAWYWKHAINDKTFLLHPCMKNQEQSKGTREKESAKQKPRHPEVSECHSQEQNSAGAKQVSTTNYG